MESGQNVKIQVEYGKKDLKEILKELLKEHYINYITSKGDEKNRQL